MKHIKKKFQNERLLSEEDKERLRSAGREIDVDEITSTTKAKKNEKILLVSEFDKGMIAFQYKENGKNYFVPEPDPVLIYYHSAYINYLGIKKTRPELFKKLENLKLSENIINDIYEFFGLSNGFVIFLFTAMEAFINKLIPEDYNYTEKTNRRTEIYNKAQIMRHISFEDKKEIILHRIFKKQFSKAHPTTESHLKNLKEFRDMIIHTKTSTEGESQYDQLFRKGLNFKYFETLNAVKDFLNFYQPGYIEDCPCENDW